MAQEIYNEGRVVGLSAWEIYVKNALSDGVLPENIPDERHWLSNMIGSGASMILKVPTGTTEGIHDYVLPGGSELAAAGVIVASPFLGECAWDTDTGSWATKVTSYSPLILNEPGEGMSPSADGTSVPYSDTYSNLTYASAVSEFVKITDGIVFTRNAKWIPTGNVPEKDINPNFNESTSVVRLYINNDVNYDIYILLTGFTNKRILQGLSGYARAEGGVSIGGSTDTANNHWASGGMLGPEIVPWASKIIFTVPSSAYNLANSLTRTIPSDAEYEARTIDGYAFKDVSATVKANSFIDLNSIDITDYYTNHTFTTSPTLVENVTKVALGLNDSYNSLVAWYPGMTAAKINAAQDSSGIFPPAIYAAQVSSTGTQTLVPLDVAAPGTVKGFEDPTVAYNYVTQMPNNYAVYHNTVNNTFSYVIQGDNDPTHWSGSAKIEYLSGDYPVVTITAGSVKSKAIALTAADFTDYSLVGANGVETTEFGPTNYLTWSAMLKALKAGKKMNVLGERLKAVGTELETTNKIGIDTTNDAIAEIGAAKVTINPGATGVGITTTTSNNSNMATLEANTSIKVGTNFIEFSNGKRLYISMTDPGNTDVPDGSIGIGW